MFIESKGIIKVIPGKIIYIEINRDFGLFYKWLVESHFWIKLSLPRRGPHITLWSGEISNQKVNWDKVQKYKNQKASFKYNNDLRRGGQKKGFINFWSEVSLDHEIFEHVKKPRLHITIANSKNIGEYLNSYWPKMISINENQ